MTDPIANRAINDHPRCIKEFLAETDSNLINLIENRGKHYTYFGLRCKCQSKHFYIYGHKLKNEPDRKNHFLLSPLLLKCQDCDQIKELFDVRKHGLNGESELYIDVPIEGDKSKHKCSSCESDIFEILVGFEYAFDEEDVEEDEELNERVQDFFTWFILYGQCVKCSSLELIADIECA